MATVAPNPSAGSSGVKVAWIIQFVPSRTYTYAFPSAPATKVSGGVSNCAPVLLFIETATDLPTCPFASKLLETKTTCCSVHGSNMPVLA
jgi:hypothetical protein